MRVEAWLGRMIEQCAAPRHDGRPMIETLFAPAAPAPSLGKSLGPIEQRPRRPSLHTQTIDESEGGSYTHSGFGAPVRGRGDGRTVAPLPFRPPGCHIESMSKTASKHGPKPKPRNVAVIGGVRVKLVRPTGKRKLPPKAIRTAIERYRAMEKA